MNLDENLTKEEAKTKVQTAFGLDVDPTNFDPLANALDGNESARNVLLATTRLANVMKQVDAMVINLSIGTTEVGQASNLFVENLAQSIATTDSNPLMIRQPLQTLLILHLLKSKLMLISAGQLMQLLFFSLLIMQSWTQLRLPHH